jgi:phosphate transport system substrate-binding protein
MKMLSVHLLLLAAVLAAGFAAPPAVAAHARKDEAQAVGTLRITGSSTMAPLLVDFAKRFSTLYPEARIEVEAGGSARGIADVMQGKAAIGMVSRPMTGNESALYSFAIGRDGISLVVHSSNPVRSLSNRQVTELYTGKIASWKSVGGSDAQPAVINAQPGYASVELFTHFFNVKYEDIKAHAVVGENSARVRAIVENPHGIAYVSVGAAQRHAEAGAPIRLLPVDGVAATQKNIRSGNFPISRPLLLVTRDLPAGLAKEFIRFSLSAQVTDIVTGHDFVPYLD